MRCAYYYAMHPSQGVSVQRVALSNSDGTDVMTQAIGPQITRKVAYTIFHLSNLIDAMESDNGSLS